MTAEHGPAAVEALFGSVLAEAEQLRRFCCRELLAVAEEEDGAVSVGDEAEGFFELGGDLVLKELGFGVGGSGGEGEVVDGDFGDRGEDAFAAFHQAAVAGDGEHPGFDAVRIVELAPVLRNFEKGVLGYLFGVFPLAAHEPGVLEDFPLDGFEERREGRFVAGEKALGQFDFGGAHCRYGNAEAGIKRTGGEAGVERVVFGSGADAKNRV